MARTQRKLIGKAISTSLIAFAVASIANAQTDAPATDTKPELGQPWPEHARNVSRSPDWDVYEFRLHGIKYLQFTRNGTIHAVIGLVDGVTFVVPMGVDAQNVTETTAPAPSAAQVVYRDASTTVTASTQSNGATAFLVQFCPQTGCSGPGFTSQTP
ncbi:hypothetical protein [Dyella choica]|uniref:Thiol:disulfide interchange protein DsbD N-terminal domain-containing protein n=1 Tax=Dyella choica TaxID=1927959 RepID=A0A3S0R4E1_9GAMM|nr:hypothetical protein [Dyella choica]RUL76697.1 hypothetical protein EKH80_08225 [Dyella choica]